MAKIGAVGTLSPYEKAWLEKMTPELKSSIAKGVEFAKNWKPKTA